MRKLLKNALNALEKFLTWRKLWLDVPNSYFTRLVSTAVNAKEVWTKQVQILQKLMLLNPLKPLPTNCHQDQFIAKGVIWKNFRINLSNLASGMTVLQSRMKKAAQDVVEQSFKTKKLSKKAFPSTRNVSVASNAVDHWMTNCKFLLDLTKKSTAKCAILKSCILHCLWIPKIKVKSRDWTMIQMPVPDVVEKCMLMKWFNLKEDLFIKIALLALTVNISWMHLLVRLHRGKSLLELWVTLFFLTDRNPQSLI